MKTKLIVLAVSLIVVVGTDQWSKRWAENALGTPSHPMSFLIGDNDAGKTVQQFAQEKMPEILEIHRRPLIFRSMRFLKKRPLNVDTPFPELAYLYVYHRKDLNEAPRVLFSVRSNMLRAAFVDWLGLSRADVNDHVTKLAAKSKTGDVLLKSIFELSKSDLPEVSKNYVYVPTSYVPNLSRKLKKGEVLVLGHRQIEVVGNFWRYTYAENKGAAWSFLATAPSKVRSIFFTTVSVIAIGVILFLFFRLQGNPWAVTTGFALIVGGAIGNFIDRVRFNYVIDFIQWHWYDKAHWPTFNIADIAIVVGVGLLVVDMLFNKDSVLVQKKEPALKTSNA